MKASFAALVVALLCAERVSSLSCFSCDNVESNWKCYEVKSCEETDKYCFTKYFGGGVGERYKKSISKGCSATCPKGGLDLGILAFSMDCCENTMCNINGAISVKSSSLMLAVGVSASLFYIFQTRL